MKLQLHSIEHRWGDRINVDLAVHFASAPIRHIAGRLTDLSLSGAFMETEFNVRLNSLVEIVVDRVQIDQRPVYAYVTRSGVGGVGVEWCIFGPSVVRDVMRATSLIAARKRDGQ